MEDRLTIVLLGHSGVGKSATGNTILGREAFESRRSFKSVTTRIKEAAGRVFDRQVSVVDTPGILCPGVEEEIRSFCQEFRSSCLFLVVVKVDRFTEEHERAVEAALRVIGNQRRDKAFLLFTSGDALDNTLDDFINEDDECPLPNLVQRFNNRYMAFNNRSGAPQQVRELLEASGHLAVVSEGLEQRRVVLMGMCGAGKSSSGNNLLGRERFRTDPGFEAFTADCQRDSTVVEGRELVVLDTPGLNDRNTSIDNVAESILRGVQMTGPEIHAFVIVVKIDRVTEAESLLLHSLPTLFGRLAARYTMVLFTHGDKLDGQSIHDKITASRFASELVAMCSGRYCVFDNSQRRDRTQVRNFLRQVDEIVTANGGGPCCTAELRCGQFPRRPENNSSRRPESNSSRRPEINSSRRPESNSSRRPIRPMSVDEEEEELSLFQRILRFFKNLIQKIISLFSSTSCSSVPYQPLFQY